jgi:multiple sugar transport system ATP-binding protein
MARVVLENLTKLYPEKSGRNITAVDGINLAIEDREFMVLVGPSGCGKSTTLRMIAGLEEISGGTIAIDGQVVNQVLPKDRDIAMVFQNYALYPHMTVFENMAFGLKMRGTPRPEIEQRVRAAAAMLALEALLERRPKALSGGQRQRVAVGRAIVRQPKVFLFDEPLSNLDAKMRIATRAEISQLHARLGATMIYVTHDQAEAMTMGDRICVMHEGRIQQVADPLTIYNEPANLFVAGFIGSPAMNLFPGTVTTAAGQPVFSGADAQAAPLRLHLPERLARTLPAGGSSVVLGIRPENLHVADADHPGRTASAQVSLVEPMGAETFLHLATGTTPFVARVAPSVRPALGEKIVVSFDLERAHLFDAATGAVLR